MYPSLKIMEELKVNIFGGRSYYIVAIILIIISIFAFWLSFEKRKPRTREIVTISVMISLAVVGRIAFFMTPTIKPCLAIIIISGIALGKEAGVMCGTMTAFVSDFFFGQGPWTPWQMIAMGLVGLFSAIAFCEVKRQKRVYICVFGFIMAFFVYGIIMDTSTVFMMTGKPTLELLVTVYTAGIVFNFIHGIATVFFLLIISSSMLKKLSRIKLKYEMFC